MQAWLNLYSNGKSAIRVDSGGHQAGPHVFIGPADPRYCMWPEARMSQRHPCSSRSKKAPYILTTQLHHCDQSRQQSTRRAWISVACVVHLLSKGISRDLLGVKCEDSAQLSQGF